MGKPQSPHVARKGLPTVTCQGLVPSPLVAGVLFRDCSQTPGWLADQGAGAAVVIGPFCVQTSAPALGCGWGTGPCSLPCSLLWLIQPAFRAPLFGDGGRRGRAPNPPLHVGFGRPALFPRQTVLLKVLAYAQPQGLALPRQEGQCGLGHEGAVVLKDVIGQAVLGLIGGVVVPPLDIPLFRAVYGRLAGLRPGGGVLRAAPEDLL